MEVPGPHAFVMISTHPSVIQSPHPEAIHGSWKQVTHRCTQARPMVHLEATSSGSVISTLYSGPHSHFQRQERLRMENAVHLRTFLLFLVGPITPYIL